VKQQSIFVFSICILNVSCRRKTPENLLASSSPPRVVQASPWLQQPDATCCNSSSVDPDVGPRNTHGEVPVRQPMLVNCFSSLCASSGEDTFCWAHNCERSSFEGLRFDCGERPAQVPSLRRSQVVSLGRQFGCAMSRSNTLSCWGYLGARNRMPLDSAVRDSGGFSLPRSVQSVSAGYDHLCFIKNETVWCMGQNQWRQVSDTAELFVSTPSAVHLRGTAKFVAAGGNVSCAIVENVGRSVHCWGWRFGGNARSYHLPSDVVVSLDRTPLAGVELSCEEAFCCAVVGFDHRQVKCWGGVHGLFQETRVERSVVSIHVGVSLLTIVHADGTVGAIDISDLYAGRPVAEFSVPTSTHVLRAVEISGTIFLLDRDGAIYEMSRIGLQSWATRLIGRT
jgi:hypothetical protein